MESEHATGISPWSGCGQGLKTFNYLTGLEKIEKTNKGKQFDEHC
jgi:hypothetical protein